MFSLKEQDRPWGLLCLFFGGVLSCVKLCGGDQCVLPFLCLFKHCLGLLIVLERLVVSSLPCCGLLGVWCVVETGHSLVAVLGGVDPDFNV